MLPCTPNYVPYNGLFSLGANFPEFYELAYYSGKFILGGHMQFDCGSLLQKFSMCNYVQMAYKHLSLKPWILKYVLQSTIAAEAYSQNNLSGWVRELIPQAINALRDKGYATQDYFLCANRW